MRVDLPQDKTIDLPEFPGWTVSKPDGSKFVVTGTCPDTLRKRGRALSITFEYSTDGWLRGTADVIVKGEYLQQVWNRTTSAYDAGEWKRYTYHRRCSTERTLVMLVQRGESLG